MNYDIWLSHLTNSMSRAVETGDVVLPLVIGGVPVQLGQAAWLDLHQRGGDRDGRLER
ncbi:hypothetical protein [Streptosporangium subroseum]|uniref:hypothetical protein n=1 Tax=Streptosporangium subroseum TaxID=106412 RepID=UPI0030913F8F|nr:hypothetical protein OHB15_26310 [Streptosporangium subroseum]